MKKDPNIYKNPNLEPKWLQCECNCSPLLLHGGKVITFVHVQIVHVYNHALNHGEDMDQDIKNT